MTGIFTYCNCSLIISNVSLTDAAADRWSAEQQLACAPDQTLVNIRLAIEH